MCSHVQFISCITINEEQWIKSNGFKEIHSCLCFIGQGQIDAITGDSLEQIYVYCCSKPSLSGALMMVLYESNSQVLASCPMHCADSPASQSAAASGNLDPCWSGLNC